MRSTCLVRTRFILNNFSVIGLGVPGPPGPLLGLATPLTGITPLRGRQIQVGWVKIGDFRQIAGYISKTVQDRRMFSIKVE